MKPELLTQEILDNLEKKELILEIKEFDEEKGIIKGIASPYNNIDNGRDMVLPSIAKRNVGAKAPFLLQHKMSTEQGDVMFYDSPQGLMGEIHLYMDETKNGNPVFPEAHRSYVIAKKGMLKLSIGYVVHDFEYKMIQGVQVRLLKDIEIKELSRVTIPMNPKAVATEVKQEGGETLDEKDNKDVETKEMISMKRMMEGQMAKRSMGMLMNTMRDMTYDMMNQPMTKMERMAGMGMVADEFAAMYKEYATKICDSMPEMMAKDDNFDLEVKFDDLVLEAKAGKKISKMTKGEMMKAMDMMSKAMETMKAMIGMNMEEKPKSDDDHIETKDDDSDELQKKADEEMLKALESIKEITNNKGE